MAVETITLGAGCFWCVEAVFQKLKGVSSVKSGYSGGEIKNPSYREVCTGRTGHAEVIRIEFDPDIISLHKILEVFWQVHDPTTLNRQGGDVGTQYRSAIFYENESQLKIAEESKKILDQSGIYINPSVTEISPFVNFYPAEDYHDNYFKLHGDEPYCRVVIKPKMDKFKKLYNELIKSS